MRFTFAGHYLEYLKPSYSENDTSEIRLFDLETGEDKIWELAESYIDLFCVDGEYYSYDLIKDDRLTQYNADLSEVLNVYVLAD